MRAEKGVGSAFTLVLPLIVPDVSSKGGDVTIPAPTRVLYAEDGPSNQLIVRRFLEAAGCEVEIASNGALAVDTWRQAEGRGEPFDLVLMDIQMPVLDGHSAARELRRLGAKVPIVALTAHDRAEDHEAALDAGCDGFLTKPIRRDDLLRGLGPHLTDRVNQNAA